MLHEDFFCYRDNLKLCGEEFRPYYNPDRSDRKLPMVILCHGLLSSQIQCRKYARIFAAGGYAAYTFDFAGGGPIVKSQGRTQDMSIISEIRDLETVLDHVSRLYYTDENNISLFGFGQGAFVCALTAARMNRRISRLMLFSPAFCIPDDARRGKMLLARFQPRNIPDTFLCGPMFLGKKYAETLIRMRPFEIISDYEGPVLIVHGSQDILVKPRYAIKAAITYKNAVLRIIYGAGHGFLGKYDKLAIDQLRKFCHLGKRPGLLKRNRKKHNENEQNY